MFLISCDKMIEISDIDSPNAQMSLYDGLADEVAFPSESEFVEVDNGFSLRKIHENCFVYGLDMLLTKEQVEDLDDMINSSYQITMELEEHLLRRQNTSGQIKQSLTPSIPI